MLSIKNDKSKKHSDLFFLKKSIKEKNTVSKIGEKINSPKPGANNNPNDEVRRCGTLEFKKNVEKCDDKTVDTSLLVPTASTTPPV